MRALKKILPAAFVVLAASQSLAGGLQPYQPPTPDYELRLTCTPDIVPRFAPDPDPVSEISIGIRSIGGDVSMQVLHHHLSGYGSDRARQYSNFMVRQRPGVEHWEWFGQHRQHPDLHMLGIVAHTLDGRWLYLESVDNALTARTEVITKATCSLQDS